MKTKIKIGIAVLLVYGAITTAVALHFASTSTNYESMNTKLKTEMMDVKNRLSLYRLAVEQTEMKDLDAAYVFETTDAFISLYKIDENEYYNQNDEFLHGID